MSMYMIVKYLLINCRHCSDTVLNISKPGSKLCTMFLNIAKNGEIMTKINLPKPECKCTGTGNTVETVICDLPGDIMKKVTYDRESLNTDPSYPITISCVLFT